MPISFVPGVSVAPPGTASPQRGTVPLQGSPGPAVGLPPAPPPPPAPVSDEAPLAAPAASPAAPAASPAAPAAPPPPEDTSAQDSDIDDASTAQSPPDSEGERAGGAVWRAQVDSGEWADVRATCLVGRNPARRASDGPEVQLLPVADPDRSVSKTHAALGVDAQGLWVEDLGSTNGTRIRGTDGTVRALAPGARTYISPSDTVLLGDRTLTWTPR